MPDSILENIFSRFGQAAADERTPDQDLLARFLTNHDEQAFSALMQRHSGMVLAVCKRILRNPHDAEDACQAVFLVFARKAGAIRSASVASWLHGVAWNVAHKLYTSDARRKKRESAVATATPAQGEPDDMSWREVQRVVDEELSRVPQKYKDPLVLCYLEGRTQDEAAKELGCSLGALRGRLERGREMLKNRLVRRGVVGAAALVFSALLPSMTSAAPPSLIAATASASVPVLQGTSPPGVSEQVAILFRDACSGSTWLKSAVTAVAISLLVIGSAVGAICYWPSAEHVLPAPKPGLMRMKETSRLDVPGLRVWSVAYSPDGKRLAAGLGKFNDKGQPIAGGFRVWDLESRQVHFSELTAQSVRCVVFSPDGKTIATAEHDFAIRLRDAETCKVLRTLGDRRTQVDSVAFSLDGTMLFASGWNGQVTMWNANTGKLLGSVAEHRGQVFCVAAGGHDGAIASGGVDGLVRICRPDREEVLTLPGHTNSVHWLAFSPDGQTLATASWDKTVRLWDARGRPRATLQGHTVAALGVAFSPDGKMLASSAGNVSKQVNPGEVLLWDVAEGRLRSRLAFPNRVYGLAFSPDNATLAVARWDDGISFHQADPDSPADDQEQSHFVFALEQGAETVIDPAREYAADFHPTLKAEAKQSEGLSLFGPDSAEAVEYKSDGLHIKLKSGYLRRRFGTGVVTDFGIKGDFDISLSYDVLQEPSAGNLRDLRLIVVPEEQPVPDVWHQSNQNRASIGREIAVPTMPGQFVAQAATWNPEVPKDQWGNEVFNDVETIKKVSVPTSAKSGQLRLVRKDKALYFFAAESGKEPVQLQRSEFGTNDIRQVRVVGSTGGPQAALDVLVTDLHIRADSFVKAGAATPVAQATPSAGRGAWILVVIGGAAGVLVLVMVAIGIWILLRRRRPDVAAEPESKASADVLHFACGKCGRKLKAKIDRAGKKVACPRCAATVNVPDIETAEPGDA